MNKHTKARILVVEDDSAILNGLMDVLVFNGFFADGVPDGNQGLDLALKENFDLIILDVMLPGMDGFSICKAIRRAKPSQPIVMLTAKGSENDVVSGFNAGADDYISKPFSLRELMVRIEAVLRRSGKAVGDVSLVVHDIEFDGKKLLARYQDQILELTRREMDIISYLHLHKDRIVNKKELLTEIWQYADADVETRTVDIHILKLRKKLSAFLGETPFIITIRGQGYRMLTGEA